MSKAKQVVVGLTAVVACGCGSSGGSDTSVAADLRAQPGTALYVAEDGDTELESLELTPGRYRAQRRGCLGQDGCVDEGSFTADLAARTFVLRSDKTGSTRNGRIRIPGDAPLVGVKPQTVDLIIACTGLIYFAGLGLWRASGYFDRYAPSSTQQPPSSSCPPPSSNLP
jgi:hypothetical protein